MEQKTLFETEALAVPVNPNPCIALYGHGPAGKKCKTCLLLTGSQFGRKRYYKCWHRKITATAKTDHRVSWDACGMYLEET